MNFYRLTSSAFLKDALSLSGGTAVAQIITISTLPFLTRIYKPEEFGVLALYIAASSFLSVFASLKLEQVIMLPKTDRDAAGILVAILLSSTVFALLVLGVVALSSEKLSELIGKPGYESWLYTLPISIFLIGVYQALRFWQIRQTNFKLVSLAIICAIAINAAVSITIGIWGGAIYTGADGLIIGYIFQGLVNVAILAKGLREYVYEFSDMTIQHVAQSIAPHRKLVSALMLSQGIASSSMQLPILSIGGLFGSAVLGFYSMAERIISAPLVLIANALGDVYRQRAAVAWRETGRFDGIYWKTLALTSIIGIPLFSIGILLAPDAFAFVLGDEWRIAGVYAQIMLVAGLVGFISSPVDKGAVIVGATRFIVLWNMARLVGIVGVLLVAFVFRLDVYLVVWLLTLNRISIYLVNVRYEYKFSVGLEKKV